jgi:hypothetical protein
MTRTFSAIPLLISCMSFAILISFGITYLKFLNMTPINHTEIFFHDRITESILEIKKSDYCTVGSVMMLAENKPVPVTKVDDQGTSMLISIAEPNFTKTLNISVEYECQLMGLERSGDLLIASSSNND